MGKTKISRKKKGRPSKADLGRRSGLRQSGTEKSSETEPRRSLRRRNPTYHDDFYEDDEVEDDEDERREKKLKLVLKLPHKTDFGGGSAGVDSSPSQTRTEGKVAHASTAAVSSSSSDFGDGNKPFKKRKIDGEDGVYNDGEGNDVDYDEEDDARSIGSDHRKKVCHQFTHCYNLLVAVVAFAAASIELVMVLVVESIEMRVLRVSGVGSLSSAAVQLS